MTSRIVRAPHVWLLLVLAALSVAACALDDPSAGTPPSSLTGQNPNIPPTFNGTIRLSGSAAGLADGETDVFVSAQVNDLAGNPAANGTPINFATNFGTIRMLGADPAAATTAVQAIVFNGLVTVALRSDAAGVATVTAWIANVSRAVSVEFQPQSTNLSVDLVFRNGSSGVTSVEGTAPLTVDLEATVTDEEATPIAGATVRFSIADDTSGGGDAPPATIVGSETDQTTTAGTASALLRVEGVGNVVLLAEVLSDGDVVATSNQIIATTTTVAETVGMTLVLGTGATVADVTAGTSMALRVTVTDSRTSLPLPGRQVRFDIVSDTAISVNAKLANPGVSSTDSQGVATNAVTPYERSSTVVVIAQLLSGDGHVEALSNQVVITATQNIGLTLTIGSSGASGTAPAGSAVGIQVVARDVTTAALLSGQRIQFVIIKDTATNKATLANNQPTLTDAVGVATNVLNVKQAGTQVIVVARLLGPGNRVDAESNQIVITVT